MFKIFQFFNGFKRKKFTGFSDDDFNNPDKILISKDENGYLDYFVGVDDDPVKQRKVCAEALSKGKSVKLINSFTPSQKMFLGALKWSDDKDFEIDMIRAKEILKDHLKAKFPARLKEIADLDLRKFTTLRELAIFKEKFK